MSKIKKVKDKLRAKRKKRKSEEIHIITLVGDIRSEVPPSVQCTCGWVFGPSEKLLVLGREAKAHAQETGHFLRSHE